MERVNTTIRALEKCAPARTSALAGFAPFRGARLSAGRCSKAESEICFFPAYYRQLRDKDGLSHEDAIRDSIVSILMAPDFLYHLDP